MKVQKVALFAVVFCACSGRHDDNASDPLFDTGVAKETPALATALGGIVLGTPADSVLARRGHAISSVQTGGDAEGLIVEWRYPDGTYIMGRREMDGISVYRVIAIRAAPIGPTALSSSTATSSQLTENEPAGKKPGRTMASLYASSFAARYQLTAGEGWSVGKGEYNTEVNTRSLPHTMLEMTTREGLVTKAGVTFLASPTLDASQEKFVSDLIGWFNLPHTNAAALMRKINASLPRHVEQIMKVAPIQAGLLTIHAAHVGPDAVISINIR